jgi:hypothetical protein
LDFRFWILDCKKILLLTAIFTFALFPSLLAESAIDGFAKKAEMAKTDIDKSTADLVKLKKDYDETGIKIQDLKGQKAEGGITGFINAIALKVYLSKGNRLGFRIYSLEAGVRALKEDYFTYVSLITEEYGTQIKDCLKIKCPGLKELCKKRLEWASAADKYEDMLQIDLSSLKLIKDYSPGAAKDVKDYLQKKIIQAEQRIYMLDDEKGMLDIMKKAGIDAGAWEKQKNAEKTAKLNKLKKDLQEEMKKIK